MYEFIYIFFFIGVRIESSRWAKPMHTYIHTPIHKLIQSTKFTTPIWWWKNEIKPKRIFPSFFSTSFWFEWGRRSLTLNLSQLELIIEKEKKKYRAQFRFWLNMNLSCSVLALNGRKCDASFFFFFLKYHKQIVRPFFSRLACLLLIFSSSGNYYYYRRILCADLSKECHENAHKYRRRYRFLFSS